jgi:hypothetical protein
MTGNRPLTFRFEHAARSLVKLLIFMTPDLGKLFFPRLQPDQRRREMRILLAVLLTGLAVAGFTATVMIMSAEAKLR